MNLRLVIALLCGLVSGTIMAVGLVFSPISLGGVSNGAWITDRNIGSSDANSLVRSLVARRGLLALNRNEAIYFNASRDSAGHNLSERCTYEIIGEMPPARWWSLTIYAEDNFLPRNTLDHNAVNGSLVQPDPQGRVVIPVGQAEPGAIATENAGLFTLTLRLYHPDPRVIEDLDTLTFPRIERLSCAGET